MVKPQNDKTKSPQSYSDYRPIALSYHLAKVAESCIIKQLDSYVISTDQFAYRKHANTTHALIRMFHQWTQALDQTNIKYVQCLCADMSKAFDRMLPNKLLEKLIHANISKHTINLIHSYLTNRTHQVNVGDKMSSAININIGVPQGSRLGPILWIIYINDLAPPCQMTKYADDCTMHHPMSSMQDERTLQPSIDYLAEWCNENNMLLNTTKSVIMNISARKTINDYQQLSMNLQLLTTVCETKILGVLIDNHLNFASHIASVCAKASSRIYFIKKLNFYGANSSCKLRFYKACVLPIFTYAFEAWYGFISVANRQKLESIQLYALKLIFGDHSYDNLLILGNCQRISELYKLRCTKMFNRLPPHLNELCTFNNNRRSSRHHSESTYTYRYRTELHRRSFLMRSFTQNFK